MSDGFLIEQVVSADRQVDLQGRIGASPAFADLDGDGRQEAFDATVVQRRFEAALDPGGLSATGRAVLARIRGTIRDG
jgi:hypothetical protein